MVEVLGELDHNNMVEVLDELDHNNIVEVLGEINHSNVIDLENTFQVEEDSEVVLSPFTSREVESSELYSNKVFSTWEACDLFVTDWIKKMGFILKKTICNVKMAL